VAAATLCSKKDSQDLRFEQKNKSIKYASSHQIIPYNAGPSVVDATSISLTTPPPLQARYELVLDHPFLRVSPDAWARRNAHFDDSYPPHLDPPFDNSSKDDDDNAKEAPLEEG